MQSGGSQASGVIFVDSAGLLAKATGTSAIKEQIHILRQPVFIAKRENGDGKGRLHHCQGAAPRIHGKFMLTLHALKGCDSFR